MAESLLFQEVFVSTGFHNLKEDAMGVVLRSDRLSIDEVELVDALREWAEANYVSFDVYQCETDIHNTASQYIYQ